MIKVKRINGEEFVLNCELIEYVEETPDTVITLINGKKVIVIESSDEIIEKVSSYKRSIFLHDKIQRNEV